MEDKDKNNEDGGSDVEIIEEDFGPEQEKKIKKIKSELKECRKKAEEFLAGWQRAKADLINSRKEEEKNRESIIKYASEKILSDLLNVVDSFDKALPDYESGNIHEDGFGRIKNQLLAVMRGCGVEKIEAKGKKFNPAEHESVANEEVDEKGRDQMVLEEIQKGYKLYDKVLRPARVKIGIFQNKN